ncbi:hypothetical protein [uncultured Metabacillus sp.]|uniref:hypothetical protein n=1 Tax=uncultured Metabacillus sp. TaxID=2860135 RepID=UPI0026140A23|nr:hypothetical protein [uncultured Metabacillus sp.]
MNRKELYSSLNFIAREVTQFVNEHGDEIELETVQYSDHYRAVATICQEEEPFKDFYAEGISALSEKEAVSQALEELYRQAYYIN